MIDNVYIDMCASAKEIQGDFWIPQQGDYCTSTNPDIGIGMLVARTANDWEMGNEFALENEYLFFQQLNLLDKSSHWNNFLFDKKEYIFLPRSDQLFSEYTFINSDGRLTKTQNMWDRFVGEMREGTEFNAVYYNTYVEGWSINSYRQFAICFFMLDIYKKIWQDYEWKHF